MILFFPMFKRPVRKVHYQIVKLGNPDSSVSTGLVDMYAKCGDIDCSCAVFDGNLDRYGLLGASWLLAM